MSDCRLELLHSQLCIASSEITKMTINVDNLLDGLSIAAIPSELYAEDHADMPKIEFSANKILGERFFDNLSDDIQDYHSKLLFVGLRFAECSSFNSG